MRIKIPGLEEVLPAEFTVQSRTETVVFYDVLRDGEKVNVFDDADDAEAFRTEKEIASIQAADAENARRVAAWFSGRAVVKPAVGGHDVFIERGGEHGAELKSDLHRSFRGRDLGVTEAQAEAYASQYNEGTAAAAT